MYIVIIWLVKWQRLEGALNKTTIGSPAEHNLSFYIMNELKYLDGQKFFVGTTKHF